MSMVTAFSPKNYLPKQVIYNVAGFWGAYGLGRAVQTSEDSVVGVTDIAESAHERMFP